MMFNGEEYNPESCTPLYDAIGFGISKLRHSVDEDGQVLVTIITDGIENDSHEYNYKAVTQLMDKMKERGWMITYIGANQDAMREANKLHIENALDFDASEEGVSMMLAKERASRKAFYAECRCAPEEMKADFDFFGNRERKKKQKQ